MELKRETRRARGEYEIANWLDESCESLHPAKTAYDKRIDKAVGEYERKSRQLENEKRRVLGHIDTKPTKVFTPVLLGDVTAGTKS